MGERHTKSLRSDAHAPRKRYLDIFPVFVTFLKGKLIRENDMRKERIICFLSKYEENINKIQDLPMHTYLYFVLTYSHGQTFRFASGHFPSLLPTVLLSTTSG